MAKVAVVAKLTAQEGKRDELATALKVMFDAVEQEPGTLTYLLHSDNSDADVLWFYELYTGDDALASHSSSDAFKSLGGALGGLLAARPDMHLLTPLGGKGLPD